MAQTIKKINDTTYSSGNNEISVEIGNINSPQFEPHVSFRKWDNECSFTARLNGFDGGTVQELPDKIVYTKGTAVFNFYPREQEVVDVGDFLDGRAEFHEGAFEFDAVFNTQPVSNVIEYDIDFNNVQFYYQNELTEEELITVSIDRPSYVEGSYALYHPTKKWNKYGVGKIGHLYRPILRDSVGTIFLGEIDIDEQNKKLTITIPLTAYNTAVYPLTVDPTFGYTTAGASTQENADTISGSSHVFDGVAGGTARWFWWHTRTSQFSTWDYRMGAFTDPDFSVPPAQLDFQSRNGQQNGAPQGLPPPVWIRIGALYFNGNEFQMNNPLTSGTRYWLVAWMEESATGKGGTPTHHLSYDDATLTEGGAETGALWSGAGSFATLQPTFEYVTNSRLYSIYIEFEPNTNISDDLTITESVTVEAISSEENISVSDDITISDSVEIFLPFFSIDIGDDITIGEFIDLENVYTVLVIDDLDISENVVVFTTLEPNVSDDIEITEEIGRLLKPNRIYRPKGRKFDGKLNKYTPTHNTHRKLEPYDSSHPYSKKEPYDNTNPYKKKRPYT